MHTPIFSIRPNIPLILTFKYLYISMGTLGTYVK